MNPLTTSRRSGRFGSVVPFATGTFTLAAMLGLLFSHAAYAATKTVTSLADSGTGSLREAIANASDGDLIIFGLHGTVNLTGGELVIAKNLSIIGPGPPALTVDANHLSRIFNIGPGVSVSISDLTLTHGLTQNGMDGGAGDPGGAIYNASALFLTNCVITGNSTGTGATGSSGYLYGGNGGAGGAGGGIYNSGILSLTDCTLSNNSCGAGGWGGYAQFEAGSGGWGGNGGGICSLNNLTMIGCTLSGNQSGPGGHGGNTGGFLGGGGPGGFGGGVFVENFLQLTNCTIANNCAGQGGLAGTWIYPGGIGPDQPTGGGMGGYGGGIYLGGSGQSVACTIVNNAAGLPGPGSSVGQGGGVYSNPTGIPWNCANTIIALNTGDPPDVSGTFLSPGNNLIGITNGGSGFTASGDLTGQDAAPLDPKLAPLADNGGPTLTAALLPGSPAIDAGRSVGAPGTDQRGVHRPQGRAVDIGAYELQFTTPQISALKFLSPTCLSLQTCGLPNATYTVQISTNLTDWRDLAKFTADEHGLCDFVHSNLDNCSARFYRLEMGPQ